MSSITIRHGDTLNQLARKYGVTVDALVKANSIGDANKITAGAQLIIPDKFQSQTPRSAPVAGDGFDAKLAAKPEAANSNTESVAPVSTTPGQTTGGSYPTFNQGDPQWKASPMGTGGGKKNHIGAIGCAMTSVTMALDGITGQKTTPAQMNDFMRKHGGYDKSGNIQNWEVMGKAATPPVGVHRKPEGSTGPAQIDAELKAGRPVMVHVDYHGKAKGSGPDGKGDHWILVTGKTADGKYQANDPAGGKQITLHQSGNRLVADSGKPYQSTGGAVTFDRGPSKTTPTQSQPTNVQSKQPVSTTTSATPNGYASVDPATFRSGGTKSLAAIVVGNAEGNRRPNGDIVHAGHFDGHGDPANGAQNIGSFSAQGRYNTQANGNPYKADELVLNDLGANTPKFEDAARKAGLDPHNALLLSAYYDMRVQSPATADAFLKELPGLAQKGVTPQNLVEARVHAFNHNGKSGGWHDPKFANKVHADAERRVSALVAALKAQGMTPSRVAA